MTQNENGIQVEVSLSDSIQPSILTTVHPDRLVLDFPNTVADARQEHIAVNASGVRSVRYGLHAAQPPVTRLVVDLDSAHLYDLHREGNKISLIVRPTAGVQDAVHHGPPPAASGRYLEIFKKRSSWRPDADSDQALKRPIPHDAPVSGGSKAASESAPGAAHPDRGSLQEGTVLPGMGTPGTGTVPAGTGADRRVSGTVSIAASSDASTPWVTVVTPKSAKAPAEVPVQEEAAKGSAPSPPKNSASAPASQPAANAAAMTVAPAAPEVAAAQPTQVPNQVSPPPGSATPNETASVGTPAAPSTQIASPAEVTKNQASSGARVATSTPADPETASAPPVAGVPATGQGGPENTTQVQAVGNQETPDRPSAKDATTEIAAVSPNEAPPAPVTATGAAPATNPEIKDQSALTLPAIDPNLKTVFRVKYVANGVAYLDGGRSAGLAEGMKLEVKDNDLPVRQGITADPNDPRIVAELSVSGVADTSAVTDVHSPRRPVREGDLAYLSDADAQALVQQHTLSPTREYPVVIAFSEGDPLDEEVRKALPRPPQPSVNRARGRIGFDYMGTASHGTPSSTNSDVGMVLRADITRIYGTHWNLSGYWRGRLHSQSASSQATLQDLINRTYHLGMFYDNPDSRWVAGVGRMYLPWAPSLDTIDGGYFGAKLRRGTTAGFFAGSTPDPTSWSYNPDRRLAGAFVNFEGGDYDRVHYTSTSGVGISALKWQIDRPFVFFENTLSYKRYVSIYDSLQADSPRANPAVPAPGPGLSRNFLTVRLQVHPRVELDFNHNYLRDVPTYDPTLVGTGLLDKYLFQGFSAGARIEVLKQVFVYTNLGSSNRSGDAKNALNELYGLTFNRLPWWGLRADAHYSRFNSSFADGQYRAVSLGRNLTDTLRFDILVGDQRYTSSVAASDRTRFLNANVEASFGPRYFLQGGFTINRGQTQNYDQWLMTLGYRFDSRGKKQ